MVVFAAVGAADSCFGTAAHELSATNAAITRIVAKINRSFGGMVFPLLALSISYKRIAGKICDAHHTLML